MRRSSFTTVSIVVCIALATCTASDKSGLPQQRRTNAQSGNRAYKTSIIPHWFADNTRFWYRNNLRNGAREFFVVDASKGSRRRAFDHERLARSLAEAGLKDTGTERLPIENLSFELDDNALVFRSGGGYWRCNLKTYNVRKLEDEEAVAASRLLTIPMTNVPRRSTRTGPESAITFVNRTSAEVELFWLDTGGRRRSYGKLQAGQEREQHTYAGHVWRVTDGKGSLLAAFEAQESPTMVEITSRKMSHPTESGRRLSEKTTSIYVRWKTKPKFN